VGDVQLLLTYDGSALAQDAERRFRERLQLGLRTWFIDAAAQAET
jgi:hypothetical protein